jgi:hypothetical protein
VNRTFGIFNDTQYPDPISFTRTLTLAASKCPPKRVLTTWHRHQFKFDETLTCRCHNAPGRRLVLTLSVGGKEIYRDVKAVSVLPKASLASATAPAAKLEPSRRAANAARL